MRFSFSEEVRGFTSGDIETQQDPACTDSANNPISCNPTIAALQTTDDRIFTTTVTPRTAGVNHNYTLTLAAPAGRVTSAAGNKPNEEAMLEVRVAPPGVTVPISSLGRTASPGNGQVTLEMECPAEHRRFRDHPLRIPLEGERRGVRRLGERWSGGEGCDGV